MEEKIDELLKQNERSRSWLARKLNISPVTLWRKMTRQTDFKQSEKMAMALLFGVEEAYFEEA